LILVPEALILMFFVVLLNIADIALNYAAYFQPSATVILGMCLT
jgi:hypothetical protein